MRVEALAIPDVKLITPNVFGDARGWFTETYSRRALAAAGIDVEFVQDNHSYSANKGVLRGLHFQTAPHRQAKLVRVVRGAILDVAVDIRRDSPTYGQHVSALLAAQDRTQILVPIGFAHGFCTLQPDTEIVYKVSAYYAPECERGLAWDDPDLAITWPLDAEPHLSDKDKSHPRLRDLQAYP